MGRPRKYPLPVADEGTAPAPSSSVIVKVTCVIHNVHLGDGRVLGLGESADVSPDLADFLIERKQVKRG